jgi:hypothetical protein
MVNASKVLSFCVLSLVLSVVPLKAQQNPPSNQSFVGGKFVARQYVYPGIQIAPGVNNPSGAATITLHSGQVRLPDGRTIVPFSAGGTNILGQPGPYPAIPIYVGAGTARELVTPTAVSGCFIGAPQDVSCKITATFANAHGSGEQVTSGSFGIQEAINDASFWGGGVVSVDPSENFYAGAAQTITTAMAAAAPISGVTLEDDRVGPPTYWNAVAGATALATPTTLTAVTSLPSTTPVGTFTATAYNMCIAYVDIYGQEGNCSTSFVNTGAGATSSFIFSPPAASAGAVGYTIYIGLTGAGNTTLQYKVPLVTQPTVIGAYPVGNGVCTLTSVEFVTPACAVANTTYNQAGATATVTAITLSTSPIQPEVTTASTTAIYIPSPGGRTTYTYAPSGNAGAGGSIPSSWLPFTITTAAATVTPNVVGTINFPPNYMNVLGKRVEVCGEMTSTATAATIVDVQFQWDGFGQNTAGKGVLIADGTSTPTAALATAGHATFCQDFETTVISASATGGTINHVNTFGGVGGLTIVAGGPLTDAMPGANNVGVGSLNLALDSRLNIIYLHTTSTDGAGWILQNVTVKQM